MNSQGTVETLCRRKLIAPASQLLGTGNSTYWRTTREFLERFDLESPSEMVGYLERAVGPANGQSERVLGSNGTENRLKHQPADMG